MVAWPSLIGHLTSVDVKQNYSFICGMTVSWSGLAVRLVSRSCPDSASALSLLFKKVVDFTINGNGNIKMALIAAHLNAGVILVVTV